MRFCEKCGNLLKVKIDFDKKFLYCKSCNEKEVLNEEIEIKNVRNFEKKEVIVVDEDEGEFPVTEIRCPKCEVMREAYWTMQQTRGGDEPPTRFYQCKTCGWRWREYS